MSKKRIKRRTRIAEREALAYQRRPERSRDAVVLSSGRIIFW